MNVVIIKYNAGNTKSVSYALQRIGINAVISDDPAVIRAADKVIFPGVGNAATALAHLRAGGLDDVIKELTQPVLGVCLGLQLLCKHTEEGGLNCLGIFDTGVKRFKNINYNKVPHVGWNQVHDNKSVIMKNVPEDADVYYVHSFYAELCEESGSVTNYIQPFSAVLEKNNFYAAQFHIEKSGTVGETILENFIDL